MYANMHEQMITHVIQVLCGFLLTHLFFFWLFFSHTRWIYKSLLFSPALPCFLTRTSRSIFLILTLIWPRAPVLCFLCLYGWDLNQSLLVQCMLFIFLQFKEIVQRDAMWTTWLLDLCKLFGHSVPTSRISIRAKGTFVKVQVLIRPVSKIDIPVYPKGVSNWFEVQALCGSLMFLHIKTRQTMSFSQVQSCWNSKGLSSNCCQKVGSAQFFGCCIIFDALL